jgi:hypothetical protein
LEENGGRPDTDIFKTSDGKIETDVQFFYGITEGVYDLFDNYNVFKERIPKGSIPIGTDSTGNQILLELDSNKIFFFDHETEETHLSSLNFVEFLNSLYSFEVYESEFDAAIDNEDIQFFKSNISPGKSIDDIKNEFDQTAFIRSCMVGKVKLVKNLVDLGANMDQGLFIASSRGHYEIVEFLIEKGVDLEERENGLNEETPLIKAAYGGHLEVVKLLIKEGADIHAKDKNDYTALDKSRWSNNKELVDYFEKVIYKDI